ncbi:uncharacterized protein LOC107470717 [Arachis duranensis]|uniref:Uncharacterized protein LOC107470717 n=1 Tax=Arachis duranensis TaxID=130453 RepID=A0A6P4C6R7_ARADU|nr:uncharacterized protein LOC107470717 [Arachis duranensis]
MEETTAPEEQLPEKNTSSSSSSSVEEMDVDSPKAEAKADDKSKQSRGREEDDKVQPGDDKATDSKKQKVDDRKGKAKVDEQSEEKKKEKKKKKDIPTGPVKLGYRTFDSSVDMFDYFYNFLHFWPLNVNVNKYEHEMLLELSGPSKCACTPRGWAGASSSSGRMDLRKIFASANVCIVFFHCRMRCFRNLEWTPTYAAEVSTPNREGLPLPDQETDFSEIFTLRCVVHTSS